jgi:hypothetical protein
MAALRIALVVLLACGATARAQQDVPLEYHVKAAYLANFIRFVEWPLRPALGPVSICVAEPNPFGAVLEETVMDARIEGRPVVARVLSAPDDGCHVLFIPRDAPGSAGYLRAAQAGPGTLTVGETPDFIGRGGLVNFVREGVNVRFVIDAGTAERAGVRISSRLLRLARLP